MQSILCCKKDDLNKIIVVSGCVTVGERDIISNISVNWRLQNFDFCKTMSSFLPANTKTTCRVFAPPTRKASV